MPRPIWSGMITFGMVSIPVALYTATEEKDIRFNQIHEKCGSRIKLHKFCPVCEREVSAEEIQRGYEFSKGNYVIVTDEDMEEVPVPSKHTISVDAFVQQEQVDPVYFDRAYYIQPQEAGRKPFALLLKALKEKNVTALSKIALRNKEHLCLLIPSEDRVLLETLFHPDEIRDAPKVNIDDVKVDDRELKMALSLIDLLAGEFNPEKYKDEYREALMERIEAKVAGREITVAPEIPQPQVIDLMEALKASLEQAKKGGAAPEPAKKARRKSS